VIPINWFYKGKLEEEDLFDIISPIEYIPSRDYYEESGKMHTYIKALCPTHGKSLFLNWGEIIKDPGVMAEDPEVAAIALRSELYTGYRGIYYEQDSNGLHFPPSTKSRPTGKGNVYSIFICRECRKDSGYQLSLLELFG